MLKRASVLAFILMVAGIVLMVVRGQLLARSVAGITIQAAAVCLMVWARAVFGLRSFHAAANPTSGGVVTSGPYRFIRHPIYAAASYFVWAGALDHRTLLAALGAVLLTAGAGIRMLAEERLLIERYPEYRAYQERTARVVPFLV